MKYALITFMIGAFLFGWGRCSLKSKPHENKLVNARAKEPVQTNFAPDSPAAASFQLEHQNKHYTLHPRAAYAMEGLIVSEHRSDSIWDLAHEAWGDYLNSRDICTVWGRTLAGSGYRELEFHSGDWTCYYRYTRAEVAAMFNHNEISNTHVLAKDPAIRKKIAELEIGDEYRMKGLLVDYDIAGGGRRNTSLVRTDTDNGACEILYVESVEILKSHNRWARNVRDLGRYLALASLLTIFGIMIRAVFFNRHAAVFLFMFLLGVALPGRVHAKLCDASTEFCGDSMGSSSSSTSSASRGTKIRLNPAFVSVARGFGIETIYFDNQFDFTVVRGLGRIGAAISPSNSEETFFGPPGLETSESLLERNRGQHKFPNQKLTLATAFNLVETGGSGFNRFTVNLGVMGKYNRKTSAITPGGGLSGVAGIFTFGYSLYSDETRLDGLTPSSPLGSLENEVIRYNVSTYSIGAFMGPFALDYSALTMSGLEPANISVLTATARYKRSLLTAAIRKERFFRQSYDYEQNSLATTDDRTEYFGALQIAIFEPLLVGVFYNYYLLRDISFGATLFF